MTGKLSRNYSSDKTKEWWEAVDEAASKAPIITPSEPEFNQDKWSASSTRICNENPQSVRQKKESNMRDREINLFTPDSRKLHGYLTHLNDWFYGQLSSSSHNHFDGLLERAAQIRRIEAKDDTQIEFAKKYTSDCIFTQITLLICLVSKIIAGAAFNNKAHASYLWGIVSSYWKEPDELYARRYRGFCRKHKLLLVVYVIIPTLFHQHPSTTQNLSGENRLKQTTDKTHLTC